MHASLAFYSKHCLIFQMHHSQHPVIPLLVCPTLHFPLLNPSCHLLLDYTHLIDSPQIMAGSHPIIPHIAVTTDFSSSTHSLHSSDDDPRHSMLLNEHEQTLSPQSDQLVASGGLQPVRARSPSDPAFLSPFSLSPTSASGGRTSLDVPPRSPSPSASSNDGSSTVAPPSPTLSTQSSVHFATSVALRDNKPGDGTSSLGLLNTDRSVARHGRKPSWASSGEGHSSLDGTEPDHGVVGLSSLSMTAESPTNTHVETFSERSHSRSRSRAKKDSADSDGVTAISDGGQSRNIGKGRASEEEEPKSTRLDLEEDSDDSDPTPFAFKPFVLASLLDPKNLEGLENLGGVKGLLKGLGTNRTRGLGRKALIKNASSDGRSGAGDGASQRHDREDEDAVPGIVVTPPEELESGKGDDESEDEDDPAFSASLDTRRQIYGHNVLPHRATKSLLALMWLALKDKVLVCIFFVMILRARAFIVDFLQVLLSIAAVVSLALGLFQDFGTPRPAGQPPVDWVEGVAIMVAIFIVVSSPSPALLAQFYDITSRLWSVP